MTRCRCARPLLRRFRRYLRDETASVTVEAVLVLLLLLWGYFGMFILFEGYKALSSNIRSGYTISDMISRQQSMNEDALQGLNQIQEILTESPERTVLRVTVARFYDADQDGKADKGEHSLVWSHATAGVDPISEAEFDTEIVPYLPAMSDTAELVVVETYVAFVPFMNITLEQLYIPGGQSDRVVFGPFYFENLVVTRPRFANQLKWES